MAGDLAISASEVGHGLGALRDGMLAELAWKDQAHGSLDLTGGHGALPGVARDGASLAGDPLEQVVDERVEDADGVLADYSLRRHLLQYTEDVRFEAGPHSGVLSGSFGRASWTTTSTGSFGGRGVLGGSSFLSHSEAERVSVFRLLIISDQS